AYLLPAHLQVSWPTLIVWRVEDEMDALVAHRPHEIHRQRGEDPSPAPIRVSRRIDCPYGRKSSPRNCPCPSHEHSQANQLTTRFGEQNRGFPEGIQPVLPLPVLSLSGNRALPQARLDQIENRIDILGRSGPNRVR